MDIVDCVVLGAILLGVILMSLKIEELSKTNDKLNTFIEQVMTDELDGTEEGDRILGENDDRI